MFPSGQKPTVAFRQARRSEPVPYRAAAEGGGNFLRAAANSIVDPSRHNNYISQGHSHGHTQFTAKSVVIPSGAGYASMSTTASTSSAVTTSSSGTATPWGTRIGTRQPAVLGNTSSLNSGHAPLGAPRRASIVLPSNCLGAPVVGQAYRQQQPLGVGGPLRDISNTTHIQNQSKGLPGGSITTKPSLLRSKTVSINCNGSKSNNDGACIDTISAARNSNINTTNYSYSYSNSNNASNHHSIGHSNAIYTASFSICDENGLFSPHKSSSTDLGIYSDLAQPWQHSDDAEKADEYVEDMLGSLFDKEGKYMVAPSCIHGQTNIDAKMRAILIDWLVEVQGARKMAQCTLFLAVKLLDRYLAKRQVVRQRLQLVGVVALYIAAKFEERDPPSADFLVYITENSCTKEEVFNLECSFLSVLEFQVMTPTAQHFLDFFQRANEFGEIQTSLAQYILELSLLDAGSIQYRPSELAAAAVLLGNELTLVRPAWSPALARATRQSKSSLFRIVVALRSLLENQASDLQSIQNKYSRSAHHRVATLSLNSSNVGSDTTAAINLPSHP
mmetsp:Transcript_63340/g.133581  ORF Transcript_63340/g.133581 Transcript_63340/m.133581 type:complete len:559 (-) Transcript_63340:438-2114(-)|eukprot:CAMPEP_0206452326 /NCGR_PEP_ID=MMETSP0324_2-20121206/19881_1 /ASSEMBLY_ACC=CAM_ASM_000836 /TAXON_ID=2866 /ORGANISM="Crypthecodinium cohnii, Strain Seligo" /LENGTH=558 /DNA_ID=CAMNT_0053922399 /DNA_START=200 /DNA_END=1876 /DNA_ORIENTATION=+